MYAQQLLEAARAAAHLASAELQRGFGTAMEQRSKSGLHNLVTEYDERCERMIIDQLRTAFPDSGFLGEEGGGSNEGASLQWVIDPLDGTVNFAHGIPIFCVSIAAVVDGTITAGVISAPMVNEEFTVALGSGAFCNGKRLSVSTTPTVEASILVTGFPYNVSTNPDHCIEQFAALIQRGIPIRRLGSAALDLAYVASGRFDGYWEVSLHPWDMAAGVLLVEEAGGRVSHYHDRPFVLGTGSIIATNGLIHAELNSTLESVAS
ncbi:inositol monophosphatase family protein [soil metagenome]